jgi:hypothetical protein
VERPNKPLEENTAGRTLGTARSGRAPPAAAAAARVATREGLGEAPLVLATAEKEDLMDRDARRDSIKRGKDGGTREPTVGLLVSGEFYSRWRQPERQQRSESGADGKDDLSGTTHEEHAPPLFAISLPKITLYHTQY